ncbi:MAG: hypothetical protein GY730_08550 [bacterium]|nr:hypothetical protein [bacterium]
MSKKSGILLFIILAACLILAAVSVSFIGAKNSKDVVAKVKNKKITISDIDERIKMYPENTQAELNKQENKLKIVDELINEALLLNAAKDKGLYKSQDYKRQLDRAKTQIIISLLLNEEVDKKVTVSEKELKDFYNTNSAQFKKTEQRQARHILVKTKKEAQKILESLKKGVNFGELARKKSTDATATNGGSIGWFERGQLVPAFEKAAFAIKKPGDLSGIAQTQFGFHIIKLEDVRYRPKLTFAQVKDNINNSMISKKKQELSTTYLTQLKEKYKVEKTTSLIK